MQCYGSEECDQPVFRQVLARYWQVQQYTTGFRDMKAMVYKAVAKRVGVTRAGKREG